MKRTIWVVAVGLLIGLASGTSQAEDPFAAGADALAVSDSDGSASLRAKMKLKKMGPEMVMIRVTGVDDSKFPNCVVQGKVLKDAKSKKKYFKLIARGKTYKFVPVLKKRGRRLALRDKMTQNNLGACYYPPRTKLVIKVTGVDLKKKVFKAGEIYVK